MSGALAYVAQFNYGLTIANAAEPSRLIGRFDAHVPAPTAYRTIEDIWVDSSRAYLADWDYGLVIADVSSPATPAQVGYFPFPYVSAIEVHDDRAYLSSSIDARFAVLDVADPARPVQLGEVPVGKTVDIEVRGQFVYLADQTNLGRIGGLRLIDVSDPHRPIVTGHDSGCLFANGLDVSGNGNLVYLACGTNRDGAGDLRILDASNKALPRLMGRVEIPGPQESAYNIVNSVIVRDGIAYVAHDFGIDEVDVTDPTRPARGVRHLVPSPVRRMAFAMDGQLHAISPLGGHFVFALDRLFSGGFE